MAHQTEFEKLKKGQLVGTKQLRLNGMELRDFPPEIFDLAESLELLDLSENQLNKIPNEILDLQKLKIAFFSFNQFEHFPEILSQLPHLEMIGFKSNQIKHVSEDAFPDQLRWLILTENQIAVLPKSIGTKYRLQKLMLAGNKLRTLPDELSECKNLELLRISANCFEYLPDWIWQMPRLAWLAYSGNLFASSNEAQQAYKTFNWQDFAIEQKLGEGASGVISKAKYLPTKESVAVKVFKGDITSDGLPESEMQACMKANTHPNLIKIKGTIALHPESKLGLVLELLHESYKNLGSPPNFDTCTRDVFYNHPKYAINDVLNIVLQTAEVCNHFHENGIMHGDLYAHNILINNDKHIYLSDFGAATLYHNHRKKHEQIEIRAWGCLLDDLLENCLDIQSNDNQLYQRLVDLKNKCMNNIVNQRPDFEEVIRILRAFNKS